jgi:xanthine dehydrogenase accessory factor
MQQKKRTWQFIYKNLQQGNAVVLLYVLESSGSSPGRQGFFMAVNNSGDMQGSIGGGIMEHKFVEMAKSRLADGQQEHKIYRQFHDKEAASNQSGMICSGEQTIFIYTLRPGDKPVVAAIVDAMEKNRPGIVELTITGIGFKDGVLPNAFELIKKSDTDFTYREKTGYLHHLHIIGGGHCSLALSALMYSLGFYVHVYDEREGLNTLAANEHTHEKMQLHSYAELKGIIAEGRHQYVVIMTFGYRTDEVALKALLGKNLAYLGLLGSKSKVAKMFEGLLQKGVEPELLSAIHAPVGLPIKSRTPEEIAVSIAAEIIQVKNRHLP